MPSPMRRNGIDYIELVVADIARSKAFYAEAFGWTFQDYGPTYSAFADGLLEGGFTTDGVVAVSGGPLVVLYHDDLEACLNHVKAAGGHITKEIFPFPGGRRFQFADPDGYELAVWSAA